VNLDWRTTKAILLLGAAPNPVEESKIERAFVTFSRLRSKTAAAAMQFYRLRERANLSSGVA
jgi:hypothetical protein